MSVYRARSRKSRGFFKTFFGRSAAVGGHISRSREGKITEYRSECLGSDSRVLRVPSYAPCFLTFAMSARKALVSAPLGSVKYVVII